MKKILRRDKKARNQAPIVDMGNVKLNVAILQARNLCGSDRLHVSSPYAVLRANRFRFSTHTVPKGETEWNTEFSIPLKGTAGDQGVSITVWDKERFRKNYIGEVELEFKDLFCNESYLASDGNNKPRWLNLSATKDLYDKHVAGEILVKFSLASSNANDDIAKLWKGLLSAIESNSLGSSGSGYYFDTNDRASVYSAGDDSMEEDKPSLKTDEGLETLPSEVDVSKLQLSDQEKKKAEALKKKQLGGYELSASSNVIGMIFLEIVSVSDLPKYKNVTRTGFDMDPFVVISFGKKTFRTRWKRHTLNAVFNEKLLFPVQRHEQNFSINFIVMDKDRFSTNDFVADADFHIKELLKSCPEPDQETGLFKDVFKPLPSATTSGSNSSSSSITGSKGLFYRKPKSKSQPSSEASSIKEGQEPHNTVDEDVIEDADDPTQSFVDADLKSFTIPLTMKDKSWDEKCSPRLEMKARFLPYAALRQHFWRGLTRAYDIDDTETISILELSTMLESLASTLSRETMEGFFHRFNKTLDDELTMDEVVICLEGQILKDSFEISKSDESSSSTPNSNGSTEDVTRTKNEKTDSRTSVGDGSESSTNADSMSKDNKDVGKVVGERVIQISSCPICNQPRLNSRTEVDIVTHLATCASQNWSKIDAITMDRYVTASQARKRWYTKVVSKVSYGNYKLGANSANILVQDRVTGFIMEEKMSVFVRLGIRLLYKGLRSSRMENKRIKGLLRTMSIKQGKKYDNPASAQSILPFIKFHNLYMDDVLEPVEGFQTFNQFFYRKLKPGARVCDSPNNPKIAVSPADCRTTVFESVTRAMEIWIKGREFSIERLLGSAYPELVDKYVNGSLAIFRLAPQDYHRFHIPVNGVLRQPKVIEGEYYTVNPMAIRSALDVYGENVRVLVPVESEEFGTVMIVCVGAMMVGSTVITTEEGHRAQRIDELGYFQFGGSTLVVLFEPNKIVFDADLRENSADALETLVRVGMSIGHTPDEEEWERHDLKSPELASAEQKEWAQRTITGHMLMTEDIDEELYFGDEDDVKEADEHAIDLLSDF